MDNSIGQKIFRVGEAVELARRDLDHAVYAECRDLVSDGFEDVRKLIRFKDRQVELIDRYFEVEASGGTFSKIVRRLHRSVFPSGYLRRQLLNEQLRQQRSSCEVESCLLKNLRGSLNRIQNSWNAKDNCSALDVASTPRDHEAKPSLQVMVDLRHAATDGSNGGLQVYVEWLIRWCRDQVPQPVGFVAITSGLNWQYLSNLFGEEDLVLFSAESNRVACEGIAGKPTVIATTLGVEEVMKIAGVEVMYCPLQEFPFTNSEIPSVVLLVDLLHREVPSALPKEECERRESFFSDAAKHATRIQCISDSSRELLERHFPESRGKTFRTYLPVQKRLDGDRIDKVEISQEVEMAVHDKSYFFYPANLWPHKNHERLLKAFAVFLDKCEGDPWSLVCTGADSVGRKNELEALADSLGVANAIEILGYVSNDELSLVWRGASALIFPSLHEGFGIPLLEAMRYEIPILCSNRYSLSEVAGEAALYFEPDSTQEIADRMTEIHDDPELRNQLVKSGTERLNFFDAEKEALLLVDELREAANTQ